MCQSNLAARKRILVQQFRAETLPAEKVDALSDPAMSSIMLPNMRLWCESLRYRVITKKRQLDILIKELLTIHITASPWQIAEDGLAIILLYIGRKRPFSNSDGKSLANLSISARFLHTGKCNFTARRISKAMSVRLSITRVSRVETTVLIVKQVALCCSVEFTETEHGTYVFRNPSSGALYRRGVFKSCNLTPVWPTRPASTTSQQASHSHGE